MSLTVMASTNVSADSIVRQSITYMEKTIKPFKYEKSNCLLISPGLSASVPIVKTATQTQTLMVAQLNNRLPVMISCTMNSTFN